MPVLFRNLPGVRHPPNSGHLVAVHAQGDIQQRALAFEILYLTLGSMDVASTARKRTDHGSRMRGIDVGDAVGAVMIDKIDELQKIGCRTGSTLDQATGQTEVLFEHQEGFEGSRAGLNM